MTPSIWIHDLGLSAGTWTGFATGEALNLPGHGGRKRVRPATVEAYAAALTKGLPQRFHLIGHGLGGMVAIELAARMKHRIAALILIETEPTLEQGIAARSKAWAALRLVRNAGPGALASVIGRDQSRRAVTHLKNSYDAMTVAAMTDALTAARAYDGQARLADVTAPVLAVASARNARTQAVASRIETTMRKGAQAVLSAGGLLHLDATDPLLDEIETFMRRHP